MRNIAVLQKGCSYGAGSGCSVGRGVILPVADKENIIIAKSGDFAEQSGVPALAEFPIALVAGVFALLLCYTQHTATA